MDGTSVVVTAGGTREPIDAVRFLGNRSSGHQGFALAEAARERGATVTVIAANTALPLGEGIARVDVSTSAELSHAVSLHASTADVIIMAAAVADYRPKDYSASKIKKSGEPLALELVETEDILAALVAGRAAHQTIVGFAAETGDDAASALELGVAKAQRKGADLLVINAVGDGVGFGDVPNDVTVVDANGTIRGTAAGSKLTVAHAVLDIVQGVRNAG
jgi:phosphopantothenoylcysteine decarboxylase/phosphopantothenate--cysteine ligase